MIDEAKKYTVNVMYQNVIVLSMAKELDNDTELKCLPVTPGESPFTYILSVNDMGGSVLTSGFDEDELLSLAHKFKEIGWSVKKNTLAIHNLKVFRKPEKALADIVKLCHFSMIFVVVSSFISYLFNEFTLREAFCFIVLSLGFIFKIKLMVEKVKQSHKIESVYHDTLTTDKVFIEV